MASELQKEFERGLQLINGGGSSVQLGNDAKLKFYALYKQATHGPNDTPEPKGFDLVGKAKWNAWKKLGPLSKADAMKQYIASLKALVPSFASSAPAPSSSAPATPAAPAAAKGSRSGGDIDEAAQKKLIDVILSSKSGFKADLLAGKTAFITGGGSGICLGIVAGLMSHGANTVIIGRSLERSQAAAKQLMSAFPGRKCLGLSADVRDSKAVDDAVEASVKEFGQIDILVNGAAGNFLCPAEKLSTNAFRTVLEIDTVGTYNATRAVFTKGFNHSAKSQKSIINISATLHYTGLPFQVHAGSAKAAIDAMTAHLSVEWGPRGVRVNGIAPGPIEDTEGFNRLCQVGMRDKMVDSIPLRRAGTVHDISEAALFLASDSASYVSGITMVVDGGAWFTQGSLMPSSKL